VGGTPAIFTGVPADTPREVRACQQARRLLGVVVEQLVEIAHPVETPGMSDAFALDAQDTAASIAVCSECPPPETHVRAAFCRLSSCRIQENDAWA